MKPNDVVIEFYENNTYKSPKLYAIVLSKTENPKVIVCCSHEEELSLLTNRNLSTYLWNSIKPYIENKNCVYFSPSGSLYNYPLESEWSLMTPNCMFYRLSSSRELVRNKTEYGSGAAIYGGIAYNMTPNEIIADSNDVQNEFNTFAYDNNMITNDSSSCRDGVEPLPWTLTEAINIDSVLSLCYPKTEIKLLLSKESTEASFRALNGHGLRIIHLATHGFYYNGVEKPMERSGLLFAGANNTEDLSDEANDGYLYASDIAQMNLKGLDLVVLSACKTGLGQIENDGVFGLQRGFKKAGADSILMSLWRVDDEATCFLMSEFYKYWIGDKDHKSMTKYEALEKAKQSVRSNRDKGWDDLYYWGGFILLDALD